LRNGGGGMADLGREKVGENTFKNREELNRKYQ
jgi:hypothetical protein